MSDITEITQSTVAAIWRAYETDQESGYRYHLGASLIGKSCNRALWYDFRWATRATFSGRMLRLFQTGHLAEARFVADLRRAGVEVYEFDAEGKQFSFRDETGHFGGSMDGALIGLHEAPKTWHVGEFKTHNARSFAELVAKGVRVAKPRHYAQMQVYMHLSGMTRAYYLAENKDNDDLYSERIHYDPEFALRLMAKAKIVVTSQHAPRKISETPDWYECRFCDHRHVCHAGEPVERHCRSCIYSAPTCDGSGEWVCNRDGSKIDGNKQLKGCNAHLYIPDFVPGEQIDAGDWRKGQEFIVYRFPDGTEWTDGCPF